jgi:3-oxoadipyl-CoA thiolase
VGGPRGIARNPSIRAAAPVIHSPIMRNAAIVCAVRTPIGGYGGCLSSVRPDDLAALTIRELLVRTGIDPALIEDVYFGATNQAGEDNRNVARMAALLAGLPETVAGCTVNRLCASGLEAINIAARMIETGHADVLIAGGVESMSRAPWVVAKSESAFSRKAEIVDSTIGWRFTNPKMAELHEPCSMGQTAENVARRYEISREDQDAFALLSQQNWARAKTKGRFDAEIVPVAVPQRKGDPVIVDTDEHPRPEVTIEKLARLPAVFADDALGTVTPGNSSGINDGAAALLLVEAETAARLGLAPLAIVGRSATAGVDPAYMGLGPVPATRKAVERAGVTLNEIDIIELNEAFAAQSLACIRDLGLEHANINPNGGAIAMGHPLGCTGARIVVTLVHEMQRTHARRGLATLCVGVGQGVATIFESPG